jgi:DNA-binding PadR family transcriptional regulator
MKYKKSTNLNEPSTYILLALMNQQLCGYDITREVLYMTEGRVEIKPGIMYPTLSSLSNLGYIKQVDEQTEGRSKKIYDITDQGRVRIANEIDRLEQMLSVLKLAVKGGNKNE